jgi:hypothetical protein
MNRLHNHYIRNRNCTVPQFLSSALKGGVWSGLRLYRFTPGDRTPATHWIGGWVDPRAGMDAMEKRKISFLSRELNPGRPARSPVANWNTTSKSNRAGWSSGKALDLFSRDAQFESRTGHQLSWDLNVIIQHPVALGRSDLEVSALSVQRRSLFLY